MKKIVIILLLIVLIISGCILGSCSGKEKHKSACKLCIHAKRKPFHQLFYYRI